MLSITVNFANPGEPGDLGKTLGLTEDNAVVTRSPVWYLHPVKGGMQSGRTSIQLVIPVDGSGSDDDGFFVVAETSLNAWMQASALLRGKFQDEVDQPGFAVLPEPVRALLRPRYAEVLRRVLPQLTEDQALDATERFFDALGADAPPDLQGDNQPPDA